MKVIFGIDLGTTNTCVSKYQDKKFSVLEIEGENIIPSVVAWDGQEFLVGRKALNYAKVAPHLSVRSIKRLMGRPHEEISLGEMKLTPTQVSAKILAYVKDRVLEEHKLSMQDVVITVPAYFNDIERRATMQAGTLCGFNVLRIMNEPTAAALVYELGDVADFHGIVAQEEKWLIYDLGGGTFDVTLLSVRNNIKEVLSSCGNVHLGGDDFDFKIVQRFMQVLRQQNEEVPELENKTTLNFLRFLAEQLKIKLSTEAEVKILELVPCEGRNIELKMTFTREEFENLIQDEIDQTFQKIQEALSEANCQKKEVNRLLLVGGSSRIPLISKRIKKEFSLDAITYIDAETSVALGAAIQGAILSSCEFERVIIDVASHSLGMACLGEEDYAPLGVKNIGSVPPMTEKNSYLDNLIEKLQKGHAQTFAPIIRKNAKLPAKFVETFYTATDNQTEVEIPVYQGESSRVRENFFIGSFFVKLRPSIEGTPVRVGFEYDLNGTIQIYVEQEGTQRPEYFTMDLKGPVEMNLDNLVVHYLQKNENEWGLEKENRGESEKECPQVQAPINFLVQKVQERMEELKNPQEKEKISQLLRDYQHYLALNSDAELDRLEDHLHNWMENQEG